MTHLLPFVDLSIVVPAYNEAARLPLTLPQLVDFCGRNSDTEVLIVDDGGADATQACRSHLSQAHDGQTNEHPMCHGRAGGKTAKWLAERAVLVVKTYRRASKAGKS